MSAQTQLNVNLGIKDVAIRLAADEITREEADALFVVCVEPVVRSWVMGNLLAPSDQDVDLGVEVATHHLERWVSAGSLHWGLLSSGKNEATVTARAALNASGFVIADIRRQVAREHDNRSPVGVDDLVDPGMDFPARRQVANQDNAASDEDEVNTFSASEAARGATDEERCHLVVQILAARAGVPIPTTRSPWCAVSVGTPSLPPTPEWAELMTVVTTALSDGALRLWLHALASPRPPLSSDGQTLMSRMLRDAGVPSHRASRIVRLWVAANSDLDGSTHGRRRPSVRSTAEQRLCEEEWSRVDAENPSVSRICAAAAVKAGYWVVSTTSSEDSGVQKLESISINAG